jgi:hypothetical protein
MANCCPWRHPPLWPLLTFDQRIAMDLVPGAAAANLCLLGAS